MKKMQTFTVDEVYDKIGHLGYAQVVYFISLGVIQIFNAQHMILNIYAGLKPNFYCKYIDKNGRLERLNNSCLNRSISNCESIEYLENHKSIVSEDCLYLQSRTTQYTLTEKVMDCIEEEFLEILMKQERFWDLVCDKKYKVAMVQSVWMGGVMAGALFLSFLADKFGRVRTLFLAFICLIFFEAIGSFSPSYNMLIVFRFFGGMFCSLIILTSFVLSQELVGIRYRSVCGVVMTMFFSVGIAILSALASYTDDWRTLMFLVSISGLAFLIIPFFIPESPRWLVGKNRLKDAKVILENMAVKNGTSSSLPSHWTLQGTSPVSGQKQMGVISAITSHSYILFITLIQLYSWFVNSAVYYALTMSAAGATQGNVYIATALNGLVEIPANIGCIFCIERFGRKYSTCYFMLFGGLVCVIIPLLPHSYVHSMALLGKIAISASFSVIYLHSGEIYPTMIRNSAMGILSVATRIGGILAPFILLLHDFYPNCHFLVLGVLTLTGGLFNFKLPETLGRPMPENIEEVLNMRSKKHKTHSSRKENRENVNLDNIEYEKLMQNED